MKKSKSSLTRKLDRICSDITRARGKCARCGKTDYDKLQACHIFSRTYRATRWDLLNVVCLCAGCHFYFHRNPIIFGEFVKEYLGRVKYQELKQRAKSIKKWGVAEMDEYYNALKGGHYGNV